MGGQVDGVEGNVICYFGICNGLSIAYHTMEQKDMSPAVDEN